MRVMPLIVGLLVGALASVSSWAQSSGGRWEAYSPRYHSVPQTAWVKAEVVSNDPVTAQVAAAVDAQLRLHGFDPGPGGAYAVRVEMRGRGLTTPTVPIPGYDNVTRRLSIWPERDPGNSVYVSLLLYHQSTGEIFWQAEAVCVGLPADSRNIVNAMVGPLMNKIGSSGKAQLDCRPL
jgi:hypothetical protein